MTVEDKFEVEAGGFNGDGWIDLEFEDGHCV
jgi:hypothetical protein